MTIDLGLSLVGKEHPFSHVAFADTLFDPICDKVRSSSFNVRGDCLGQGMYGLQPTYTLAEALRRSTRSLRRLTLVNVSNEVVLMSSQQSHSVHHLMQNIRELRISFYHSVDLSFARFPGVDGLQEMALARKLCYGTAQCSLLFKAPNLEVLEIVQMSPVRTMEESVLRSTMGWHTWPKLRELSLQNCAIAEYEMQDLLIRHAATLERHEGIRVCFEVGSWYNALQDVRNWMVKLKEVVVRY